MRLQIQAHIQSTERNLNSCNTAEVALKVLNDLHYENKISLSDNEIKEMIQTLQELLTVIKNQETDDQT